MSQFLTTFKDIGICSVIQGFNNSTNQDFYKKLQKYGKNKKNGKNYKKWEKFYKKWGKFFKKWGKLLKMGKLQKLGINYTK